MKGFPSPRKESRKARQQAKGSRHPPQGLFKDSPQQGQIRHSPLGICSHAGLSCQALLPHSLLNIWVPSQLKESHDQGEGCLQEPEKSQTLSLVLHKGNPYYKKMPLSGRSAYPEQDRTLGTITLNPFQSWPQSQHLKGLMLRACSGTHWGGPSLSLRDPATHICLFQ